jgi:transcriptional regulator with XRE-family HTH domain
MKIEVRNSDAAVLKELGTRLSRNRLERNMSQAQLALEAGVSKTTVERLEAGRSVKLESFVRILRALGQLELLDRLLPEPLPSPIQRARLHGKRRQRATGRRGRAQPDEQAPWQWGSDSEGA